MTINDENWGLLVAAVASMQWERLVYQEADEATRPLLIARVTFSQLEVLKAAETVTGNLLGPAL